MQIPVSTGSVFNFNKEAYEGLAFFEQRMKTRLAQSDLRELERAWEQDQHQRAKPMQTLLIDTVKVTDSIRLKHRSKSLFKHQRFRPDEQPV